MKTFSRLLALAILLMPFAAIAQEDDPPPPFARKPKIPKEARTGVLSMNNGKTVIVPIYLKGAKLMKVYDRGRRQYFLIKLAELKRIDVEIEKEWIEGTWRWKEAGQDEKVYFGPTYPARKYVTTFALGTGRKLTGDYSGPIYVMAGGKSVRYLLHKRDKGEKGTKMEDLLYIKSISFDEKDIEKARRAAATQPASSSTQPKCPVITKPATEK